MKIRQLHAGDAVAYQAIRLEGLQESPTAFGSSYAEEVGRTIPDIAARLQISPATTVSVFGAFTDDQLVGIGALARNAVAKTTHSATVCALFTTPSFRRLGIGRALLDAIISHAQTFPHLRNLRLAVNSTNEAAIRLYQSRGFVGYGLTEEALCVDGVFYDEALYALRLNR